MKKLLSILLVLLLVTGSACAETSTYYMTKYTVLAKIYGAPVLDKDMLQEETEKVIKYYNGDLWIMFGAVKSEKINSACVIGADSIDFLPACVCAALTIPNPDDGFVDFMGGLLYAYMTVKSGKDAAYGYFDYLQFAITRVENGLQFLIGEP